MSGADIPADSVDYFSEKGFIEVRPNLFRIYKLASLSIGYGPRNITPYECPFKVYLDDIVPTNSLLRCLQTSTYLSEYSPEIYCDLPILREIWRVRDRQAGLFTSIYSLKPWSALNGSNKTFIHETLQKAYDRAIGVKALSDSTPSAGGKIVFKSKIGSSSTTVAPMSGSPGPS